MEMREADVTAEYANFSWSITPPSLTPFLLSCAVCTSKCDLLWCSIFFEAVLGPLCLPLMSLHSFCVSCSSVKARFNPEGSTAASANKPSPAKKAQSVTEILLYLYSRGKVCWHCSEALFNLLQSEGGSREPSTHPTAPQVCRSEVL